MMPTWARRPIRRVREMVRREIEAAHPASLEKLQGQFFADHRQQDWSAELSQYISFALCVEAPPDFKYRYHHNELPPDVARLDDFRAAADPVPQGSPDSTSCG